ncbi:MAG: hypoxanthine phosphoribosyltransferase [Muribaculaceae bacterium]|nr:hypoxanthine phosphoribosyltransferase [Muribaculaceae bacterium]
MNNKVTYNGLTFKPYITEEQIAARIAEIGAQITEEFRGRNPLLICVLNGAFPFAADLFRRIDTDAEITFVRFKSYDGMASTGQVRQVMGLQENIEGRPVIVVEDIIDSGHTIVQLLETLGHSNPSDLKVATLLFKPDSLKHTVKPDYVGFSIKPDFIIGFGLDLDGKARNLRDIYVLDN